MGYNAIAALAWAAERIGFHEGPDNSNPFSVWQGLDNNNPWCASFVSEAVCEGGGYRFPPNSTFGWKGEAYVPTMKQRAEQEGLWRDRSYIGRAGDLVCYDWQGDGELDHVELVVADDGTTLRTIGGNTGDAVQGRSRNKNNVGGFYALSHSSQVELPPKVKPMFSPALEVVAALANPDGGAWMARGDGSVVFINNAGTTIEGGMISNADRQHFAGRKVARLEPRAYGPGGRLHGYTIVAQSGEKYVPQGQR